MCVCSPRTCVVAYQIRCDKIRTKKKSICPLAVYIWFKFQCCLPCGLIDMTSDYGAMLGYNHLPFTIYH